jgi:hypothetical protein
MTRPLRLEYASAVYYTMWMAHFSQPAANPETFSEMAAL